MKFKKMSEEILQLKDEIKKDLCEMLEFKLDTIDVKMDEIKKDVLEIKSQTQRTNGRVSSLENWKWFITGGLAILAFVIGVLLKFIQI